MPFTINRSCSKENALITRKTLLESGAVEAHSEEEAEKIEADGGMAFIDLTNKGTNLFSNQD